MVVIRTIMVLSTSRQIASSKSLMMSAWALDCWEWAALRKMVVFVSCFYYETVGSFLQPFVGSLLQTLKQQPGEPIDQNSVECKYCRCENVIVNY